MLREISRFRRISLKFNAMKGILLEAALQFFWEFQHLLGKQTISTHLIQSVLNSWEFVSVRSIFNQFLNVKLDVCNASISEYISNERIVKSRKSSKNCQKFNNKRNLNDWTELQQNYEWSYALANCTQLSEIVFRPNRIFVRILLRNQTSMIVRCFRRLHFP